MNQCKEPGMVGHSYHPRGKEAETQGCPELAGELPKLLLELQNRETLCQKVEQVVS